MDKTMNKRPSQRLQLIGLNLVNYYKVIGRSETAEYLFKGQVLNRISIF